MKVIRCGFMHRSGFLSKWHQSYFVLTDSGWLHCFDGSLPKNTEIFEISNEANACDFESFHMFDSKLSLHYR